MLLHGNIYVIATRKLRYWKTIALKSSFCSIFPSLLLPFFLKDGKMESYFSTYTAKVEAGTSVSSTAPETLIYFSTGRMRAGFLREFSAVG